MNNRRTKSILIAVVLIAALFLNMAPVTAMPHEDGGGTNIDITDRITDLNFRNYVYDLIGKSRSERIFYNDVIQIMSLACENMQIASLNGIEYFSLLRVLYCPNNQLTTLNLSNNQMLEELFCQNNRLSSLNLSNNAALVNLMCDDNRLTSLDVSKCGALTNIWCRNNQLTSLDVSNNTSINFIDCRNNNMPNTAAVKAASGIAEFYFDPQGGGGTPPSEEGTIQPHGAETGDPSVVVEPPPVDERASGLFDDVYLDDWFYGDVAYVNGKGLMLGTDPALFSPNMTMTRGMVVTVLYRMVGSPGVTGLANPFNDVAEGMYYTDGVKWAAANNIVFGYRGGRFGHGDNITRQDLAVMLTRYAYVTNAALTGKADYSVFNDDREIADYARASIEWSFKVGIISGKPGNIFDPKGNATRAEFAAMLHRFLG